MGFLWTYVLGPVLALLPRRWRQALGRVEVHWERAGAWSGMLEILGGIVALGYWYMYGMGRMVNAGLDSAMSGKLGRVTDLEIGGVSLVVFLMHPVTWLLAYFIFEGAVRLCAAAFTETVVPTLPLATAEWMIGLFRAREERPTEALKRNVGSFAGAMKEKVLESRTKDAPDELSYQRNGQEESLEIRACKKKAEWTAPKVVRVDEVYYRLEEAGVRSGGRPFWYRLKRLSAGVPGRNVILYKTPAAR